MMHCIQTCMLDSPITAVTSSPPGNVAAAATESAEVSLFSLEGQQPESLWQTSLAGTLPGFEIDDLVFVNGELVAVGGSKRVEGPHLLSSGGLVFLNDSGSITGTALLPIEPPLSPSLIEDSDSRMVMGSLFELSNIDTDSSEILAKHEFEDTWVAHRGVLQKHNNKDEALVLLENQGGTKIVCLCQSDDEFLEDAEGGTDLLPFFSRGAALSEDDQLLVVTLNELSGLENPPSKSKSLVIGQTRVYRTTDFESIASYPIEGHIGKELILKDNVSRLQNGEWIPVEIYHAQAMISNPVFVSRDRIAFGTPGGAVRVINTQGQLCSEAQICDAPITSIAFSSNVLICGCADGGVRFLSLDQGT